MYFRRIWLVGSVTLMLAGLMVATTGAGASAGMSGYSVGIDSYTIGSVTANPGTAYIGDAVTFNGVGQLPNAVLEVGIGGTADNVTYTKLMGTARADAAGNWAMTALVPSTVTRESDKTEVPTLYGTWTVLGLTIGPDGGAYGSTGSLTVVENVPANTTQTTAQTTSKNSTLPNTGMPPVAPWLLGSGLLAAAGLGVERVRSRRRR